MTDIRESLLDDGYLAKLSDTELDVEITRRRKMYREAYLEYTDAKWALDVAFYELRRRSRGS